MTKERTQQQQQQATEQKRIDWSKVKISKGFMKFAKENAPKLAEKIVVSPEGLWSNVNELHFSAKGQYATTLAKYRASKEQVPNSEPVKTEPVKAVEPVKPVEPVSTKGLRRNAYELANGLEAGQDPNRKGSSKPKAVKAKVIVPVVETASEPVKVDNTMSELMAMVKTLAQEVQQLKAQPASTGKTVNINFSNL